MYQAIFMAAGWTVSIFSLLCFIRLLLSWFPDMAWSSGGRFLIRLCDPYLNWFRRFTFSRVGALDFSPIIALGVLYLVAMTFHNISDTGRISVGIILALLLDICWSLTGFIFTLFIILTAVRLFVEVSGKYSGAALWIGYDNLFSRHIKKLAGYFGMRFASWRNMLLLALIAAIVLRIALGWGYTLLRLVLISLPV